MSTPSNPNYGERYNNAKAPHHSEPNRVLPEEPPAINEKSKKPVWPWVIGLLLMSLLIWGGCAILGNQSNNESVRAELKTTSSSNATVNYGPADSTVAEDFEKEWSKSVDAVSPKDNYGLSVKSEDSAATVKCQISVDGVVQSESEAKDGKEAVCKLPEDIKK